MSFLAVGGIVIVLLTLFLGFYLRLNDWRLARVPEDALILSPKRSTAEDARSLAAQLDESPPISIHDQLPPKTGRRYIVVGGVRSNHTVFIYARETEFMNY